jgi:hypothetical protein
LNSGRIQGTPYQVVDGALIAECDFTTAGGNVSAYWARWGCAAPAPCSGDMNCDGHVTFTDIDPFVAVIGTTCP